MLVSINTLTVGWNNTGYDGQSKRYLRMADRFSVETEMRKAACDTLDAVIRGIYDVSGE